MLKKRIKSFAWRLGGMILVAIIGFIIEPEIAQSIGLPTISVAVLGLVMGEITKQLNSK